MTPTRRQVVVMVKEPNPGRVKTRLGKDIGMVPACWWFRHQTAQLLRRLGSDPRIDLTLAVSPDHAGLTSRVWPAHLPRIPQGRGDLGQRMGRIFRAMPPGPVVIIGGDIPGIRPGHLLRAFALLGRSDAVLGPASDGGYWLIGLKRTSPTPSTIFQGVRWSSEHALNDTVASLGATRLAFADQLDDVDTAKDLDHLHRTP